MASTSLSRRQLLAQGAAGGLALGMGPLAFAQADWPRQPIKFIVPFAAGGATDLTMRTVSQKVAEKIGQPIVIDNRAGAGGAVGLTAIAKAPADGYTIGATASASVIATPLLNPQVAYDPNVDIAFVSLLATVPMVLTVPTNAPVQNAADFLKYVAANKNKLSYGSVAVGHYSHVAMMEVSDSLGAGMVHSPYKGETPLLQDVLGGQLNCAFFVLSTARPSIEAGKLRAIGVTGSSRLKSLPNVPTLAEQGWSAPVFRMNPGWVGVVAPAQMPAPMLQRLSSEYSAAVRTPEINDKINEYGMHPVGSSGAEFLATYKAERPVWKGLLTKAGLEVKGT